MADIQEIYARLLSQRYQEELFSDLQMDHREGKETLAECPFCGDEDHFSYSSEGPVWQCWKCGESGDWIKYLEKRQGYSFREAVLELAQAAGLEVSGFDQRAYDGYLRRAGLLEATQDLFVKDLFQDEEQGLSVLEYLTERGYSSPEVEQMGLGAYVSQDRLQQELQEQGFSLEEIRRSGLLLSTRRGALGETHKLTLLWRDPAGRAIGLAVRSLLSREERESGGLAKYLYSAGLQKSKGLIGLRSARGSGEVILTEGPLDALLLNSKGLPAVAMGGTSLSDAQIRAIQANRTEGLILALDADRAGKQATERVIQSLRGSGIRPYVVSLPEGLDPDEVIRGRGLEAFQEALRQAESWASWQARYILSGYDLSTDRGLDRALEATLSTWAGIEDKIEQRLFWDSLKEETGLSDEDLALRGSKLEEKASRQRAQEIIRATLRKVDERASEGDILGVERELTDGLQQIKSSRGVAAPDPYLFEDFQEDILSTSEGLSTGYDSLDDILRIPEGALTILAGRPGHGKTVTLLNFLLRQIERYPDRAFYHFSYEEAKKFIFLKLLMIESEEVLSQDFNQGAYVNYLKEKRGQKQAIEEAIAKLEGYTSSGRLMISDQMLRAEDLASTIGYLAKRGDVGAVFVDYIQKVGLQQPPQGQRYLEIKRVSELLLEQAVAWDLAIVLGAQLSRAGVGQEIRLEHLRESGDIEQDASLVLGLYNSSVAQTDEDLRADTSREIELRYDVLKNRAGVAGKRVKLVLDRPVLRIRDGQVTPGGLY